MLKNCSSEAFKANSNIQPIGKGYEKSPRKVKALQQKQDRKKEKGRDKEENVVDAGEEPEIEEEVHVDTCIPSTSN